MNRLSVLKILNHTKYYLTPLFVVFCFYLLINMSHSPGLSVTGGGRSKAFSFTGNGSVAPDFSKIADVSEKKELFFNFMQPIIEDENKRILEKRESILRVLGQKLVFRADQAGIAELASEYKISPFDINNKEDREELLARVDIVPAGLAMVQAANETAWGTSRFARLGNNMFGQWCFSGCEGIVPERRDAGANHKVAMFETINSSVSGYLHNLNTGKSYQKFRDIRKAQRLSGEFPDPVRLAAGLTKYSELGEKYVTIIISMLKTNKDLITKE